MNKWIFCNSIENIVNNAIIGFAIDLERNIVFPRYSKMKLKMLLKNQILIEKMNSMLMCTKKILIIVNFFTREWLFI